MKLDISIIKEIEKIAYECCLDVYEPRIYKEDFYKLLGELDLVFKPNDPSQSILIKK